MVSDVADEEQYRYCERHQHQAPVPFDLEAEDGSVSHDEQNRARRVQDRIESRESAKNQLPLAPGGCLAVIPSGPGSTRADSSSLRSSE
jgi:hypothetical protein